MVARFFQQETHTFGHTYTSTWTHTHIQTDNHKHRHTHPCIQRQIFFKPTTLYQHWLHSATLLIDNPVIQPTCKNEQFFGVVIVQPGKLTATGSNSESSQSNPIFSAEFLICLESPVADPGGSLGQLTPPFSTKSICHNGLLTPLLD